MPKPQKSSKEAVIEVLNKARGDELAAIFQYMAQHYALADADYGQVAANLKLIAQDEMRHAEMLAERIFELEGLPVAAPSCPAKRGQKIQEVFPFNVKMELQALEDYNASREVCIANRDSLSAKLFELLLEEEQLHLTYFQNVSRHLEELGPVYLAQLAGGPAESAPAGKPIGFVANQRGGA